MAASRVILITGASAGIGRACAVGLSKAFPSAEHPEPLVLALMGRREEELKATAEQCREGTKIEVLSGDVSSEDDVKRVFGVIKEKYGRLDLLFNNAGVNLLKGSALEDSDMDKFRKTLDVNVMGAVLCTAAAVRLMKEQSPQGGRIVNNGSISASSPRPDSTSYTVSKHAILGLTRSTSLDGRKYHIAATQLDIGNALTDLSQGSGKGTPQADGSIKVEPLFDVNEVARTLAYLAALPRNVEVLHLEILALGMPYVGRG
ncbi:3-beta-hydroxycholanate 3-dehydrogenase (NADP(+)) [Vanrija pseudolonga]|uniref:3-beta-hydroxycholanate 3-dehydrogenase (NADP(+)) n=1 Tax=Vanrija pseudolonga TaxID=143232 RepID=A0AAF0YC11_9TREE|nr:3-beta-hydroxycholanate 3-dehydrogenase (NADP(+)) [Vanrija pseudolonga]